MVVVVVVPACNAQARKHMGHDNRDGVEPYRPTGYDDQSCGEQSRRPQTSGERSTSSRYSNKIVDSCNLVSRHRSTGRPADNGSLTA